MTNKTSEILTKAKALIDTPAKWTQGALARNESGNITSVDHGTCFCSVGAIEKATSSHDDPVVSGYFAAIDALAAVSEKSFLSVAHWNDNSTHEVVMQGFDEAIANCKKAEKGNDA